MNGIIIGDLPYYIAKRDKNVGTYITGRIAIGRANGAHRIASLLRKKDINVEVIDFFNDWTLEELQQFVRKYDDLTFVGLSLSYTSLDNAKVKRFTSIVKQIFPNVKVLAGGSEVLSFNFPEVDYFFTGFADGAVDEIVNYLSTGRINLLTVKNVKTHDVKKVIDCNKHYGSYDLTNLKTQYSPNDFISKYENLSIETSRGCVFKCKFCNFPLTGKNKNDYIRDKEDIKSEFIFNYENYGTTRYNITDDTFNDNEYKVKILHEITQELDFKLSFNCFARVDLFHAKPHTLDMMVEMGTKGMTFGIETLKESSAKKIGKGFSGERLKNYLIEIKQKYPDLHLTGSFILGLPDESYEEAEENVNWCVENKIFSTIYVRGLYITLDNEVNNNSIFTKDWQKYGYEHMTDQEVYDFVNQHPEIHKHLPNFIYEGQKKHKIFWKNNHGNYLSALIRANDIYAKIFKDLSFSGWFCFGAANEHFSLEDILKTTRKDFDEAKALEYASMFVNKYKKNKLSINL